jgi:hypothetical protein
LAYPRRKPALSTPERLLNQRERRDIGTGRTLLEMNGIFGDESFAIRGLLPFRRRGGVWVARIATERLAGTIAGSVIPDPLFMASRPVQCPRPAPSTRWTSISYPRTDSNTTRLLRPIGTLRIWWRRFSGVPGRRLLFLCHSRGRLVARVAADRLRESGRQERISLDVRNAAPRYKRRRCLVARSRAVLHQRPVLQRIGHTRRGRRCRKAQAWDDPKTSNWA